MWENIHLLGQIPAMSSTCCSKWRKHCGILLCFISIVINSARYAFIISFIQGRWSIALFFCFCFDCFNQCLHCHWVLKTKRMPPRRNRLKEKTWSDKWVDREKEKQHNKKDKKLPWIELVALKFVYSLKLPLFFRWNVCVCVSLCQLPGLFVVLSIDFDAIDAYVRKKHRKRKSLRERCCGLVGCT